jgi:hypothetical protein
VVGSLIFCSAGGGGGYGGGGRGGGGYEGGGGYGGGRGECSSWPDSIWQGGYLDKSPTLGLGLSLHLVMWYLALLSGSLGMIKMVAMDTLAVAGGRVGRHALCVAAISEAGCCSAEGLCGWWCGWLGMVRLFCAMLLTATVLVSSPNPSVQQLIVSGLNSSRFAE